MNLVIDQGNTVCKLAVCSAERIIDVYSVLHPDIDTLRSILARYPQIDSAVYSTVGRWEDAFPNVLSQLIAHVVIISANTLVPLVINYDRAKLGSDRLAAIVGANYLSPERECLVIDAGTAITYERITASGIFVGGNISPGLYVRLKGMHNFTSRLPLIEDMTPSIGLGNDTVSAMTRGVVLGVVYEAEGYIRSLRAEHPTGIVYLTGGDAEIIQKYFDTDVVVVPDLVLHGLNQILEYNKRC